MNTEVLIVGGGLSGLHSAYQLEKKGILFVLIEARDRLGGRILSENYTSHDSEHALYEDSEPAYDLGPSWFWPGQENMETLLKELGLAGAVFAQQGRGEAVYEDQQGNIQKGFHGISMAGTYRIQGGIRQIISTLTEGINLERIRLHTEVVKVEITETKDVMLKLKSNNSDAGSQIETLTAKKVIFALPPRIAMSKIQFVPALDQSRIDELNSYATWMAGHAKIIAVYEKPFWNELGLSGDGVSHLGPLREIHDASSNTEDFALFGFVGVEASHRKGNESVICDAIVDQLVRMFGEKAAKPLNVIIKDWAQEEFTATDKDQTMSGGHAQISMRQYTETKFEDKLIWSGTETASHLQGTNGFLEGALESSIRTLEILDI